MIITSISPLDPPNVTLASEDLVVNNSDTFLLFCDINGIPAPAVVWYLNNVPLHNSGELFVISTSYETLLLNVEKTTSTLKVLNASKDAEGNYSCVGSNSAENFIGADHKHTMSVFVQG